MKPFRALAVLFVLGLVLVPAAFGAEIGVRAGRFNDAEDEFVGVEAAFGNQFQVVPNIEYILTDDDTTALTGNVDVQYNFLTGTVRPYIGAGVGFLYVDDDFFGDTTEELFNVIGGVKFDLDFLKPYVQVKYFRLFEEGNADDIAFTVGLRF